jgi:hypothetical protein
VKPDPEPRPGKGECGRATRHAAADDHDVGCAVEPPSRNRRRWLVQPVGVAGSQPRREVAFFSGTKARLPSSLTPLTEL